MKPIYIVLLIFIYFGILILISRFTGKNDTNDAFFRADRRSPWYLVAFGMIGATLSGVTFISVPGWVGATQFGYLQVVLGNVLGYVVIIAVLLPIYYKLKVTSIYQYLDNRFGFTSYKTGATFFFLSQMMGASLRLYLVALVLDEFVFSNWNIPFYVTVIIAVALIWLYTNRGGIKTIVYTDTLQTFFMLTSVVVTVYLIMKNLNWNITDLFTSPDIKQYTKTFFTDDFLKKDYFWKAFLGGAFITITMTGLDQNMMQKNLTCKNIREAQKNVISYSVVFILAIIMFLFLGALLYVYATKSGMGLPERADLLFPEIALNGGMGLTLAIAFLLGLIASAYSSADSALAALTTSFCIDFLNIEKRQAKHQIKIRRKVHIGISAAMALIIIVSNQFLSESVIDSIFMVASYTYGPLLGLFAFGIMTKWEVEDKWVWVVALIAFGLSLTLGTIPAEYLRGYEFNYELLGVNGLLTFIGLLIIKKKTKVDSENIK